MQVALCTTSCARAYRPCDSEIGHPVKNELRSFVSSATREVVHSAVFGNIRMGKEHVDNRTRLQWFSLRYRAHRCCGQSRVGWLICPQYDSILTTFDCAYCVVRMLQLFTMAFLRETISHRMLHTAKRSNPLMSGLPHHREHREHWCVDKQTNFPTNRTQLVGRSELAVTQSRSSTPSYVMRRASVKRVLATGQSSPRNPVMMMSCYAQEGNQSTSAKGTTT